MEERNFTFGERLRQIRIKMEMTQDRFAKKLGTSKQVISKYETNQRTPKISVVIDYADKLGVSFFYMCGYTDKELTPKISLENSEGLAKIMADNSYDLELKTGIPEAVFEAIRNRDTNYLEFPVAWHLSETLGIPIEVWADKVSEPPYVTVEARKVALLYDKTAAQWQDIICRILGVIRSEG